MISAANAKRNVTKKNKWFGGKRDKTKIFTQGYQYTTYILWDERHDKVASQTSDISSNSLIITRDNNGKLDRQSQFCQNTIIN